MSYVFALPDVISTAATDVASIGTAVATANRGVAEATTAVLAAAEDEVSTAIAALFSAHGQGYQALTAHAAAFHERFVQALASATGHMPPLRRPMRRRWLPWNRRSWESSGNCTRRRTLSQAKRQRWQPRHGLDLNL